ncbi:MAG: protein kinase [Candidatus Schekmanbacteria bacterium]|nr:protein kinase [Candidatus Schekmanbacteria bacterium]
MTFSRKDRATTESSEATGAAVGRAARPNMDSIAHYALLEVIGTGGMGAVYKARDVRSGALVALKTLKVSAPPVARAIRREADALLRVCHPGVVRVLETGEQEGMPWYAMELLPGKTLAAHFVHLAAAKTAPTDCGSTRPAAGLPPTTPHDVDSARAPELASAAPRPAISPANLSEVLSLFIALCEVLEYVHGEGIVHRDLKPANVIVSADGLPVLFDFGIASFFAGAEDRELLFSEVQAVGTLPYMAPEQIRGELVDARADLYSLGCILYEALTGSTPFRSARSHEILQGHLRHSPVPPSYRVGGVSPELEAIVLRLLAKSPRERIGYGRDVGSLLAAAQGGRRRPPLPYPQPRAYLYRTGFHGRAEELRMLMALCEQAQLVATPGTLALLAGESGIGKTRVLLELVRLLTQQRVAVVGTSVPRGPCHEVGGTRAGDGAGAGTGAGSSLLGAWRPVLELAAERCALLGQEETARLLGDAAPLLAAFEPRLHLVPGFARYREPAPLPVAAARTRLFLALRELLRALAEDGPLVVLLDDAQWLDELSLAFLSFVAASPTDSYARVVVAVAYRLEEEPAALAEARRRPGVNSCLMRAIDAPALSAMVFDMLALDYEPRHLVQFLCEVSGGNPFYAAQYLRAAVEEGYLRRSGRGIWEVVEVGEAARATSYASLPIPRGLHDLIAGRLARLAPETTSVLELAAVAGRRVDAQLLEEVAGQTSGELYRALSDLLRSAILEDAGGGELTFVHDQLREVAYERIEVRRKRGLHVGVAEWLAAAPAGARGGWAEQARHWDLGGHASEAREAYLQAAARAQEAAALAESERYLSRALELLPTSELRARADILRRRAEVRDLAGDAPGALADLTAATRIAEHSRDAAGTIGCLLDAAYVHLRVQQYADASRSALAAIAVTADDAAAPARHRAHGCAGVASWRQGDPAASLRHLDEAIAGARAAGAHAQLAESLTFSVLVLQETGRTEAASARCAEALELCAKLPDRRGAATVLGNLALFHFRAGNLDDAEALYERTREIYRGIGDRRALATVLGNTGALLVERGALPRALAAFDEAAATSLAIGDELAGLRQENNRAIVLRELGELRVALDGAARVVARHEALRHPRDLVWSLYTRGALRADCGALAGARDDIERSLLLAEQHGDLFAAAECREKLAEIHWNAGQGDAAVVSWRHAREAAAAIGYRSVEMVSLAWLYCSEAEAAPGTLATLLAFLDSPAAQVDSETSVEVALLVAEALLAGPQVAPEAARQALDLLGRANEMAHRRGNVRSAYLLEWLRHRALAAAGGGAAEAAAARRRAASLFLEALAAVPAGMRAAFGALPRVAPLLAALDTSGRDLAAELTGAREKRGHE